MKTSAALEEKLADLTDETPQTTVTKPKRPRAGRQPLPEHLPRIEHRHEPDSCQCGQCGKAFSQDWRRHYRTTGCRTCQVLCASAYPPTICVPPLRNGHRRTHSACSHRRWHGRCRFTVLGAESANTWTTCRCTVWNKSPPASRSPCPVPPWPNGSGARAWRCNP